MDIVTEALKIIQDRRLSATSITYKLLNVLNVHRTDKQTVARLARLAYKRRPAMPILGNVLLALSILMERGLEAGEAISLLTNRLNESVSKAVEIAAKPLSGHSLIATLSYSSQVYRSILLARPKKVLILESNPGGEGKALHASLMKEGIEADLFPDSAICYIATLAEIGVLGADALYSDGFLNKVGSKGLALSLLNLDKPVMVTSTSFKFDPERRHRFEYAEWERGCPLFEFVEAGERVTLVLEDEVGRWRYRNPIEFIAHV
jgi:translation initiation factor 2B subunit (eIF-2B alpha/beta/delta family)